MAYLAAILIVAAANAAPLPALGTWRVSYEDSQCIASRPFGTLKSPVTFAISVTPMETEAGRQFVLLSPPDRGRPRRDKASISIQPSGASATGNYLSAVLPDRSGRLTRFDIDTAPLLFELPSARTVEFKMEGLSNVSIAPAAIQLALRSLDQCAREVAIRWGVPASAIDAVAVKAVPAEPPARWYSTNDFPMAAVSHHVSGATTMLWSVSTGGRVTDCKVVGQSGNRALDDASCATVRARAKFKPAQDHSGQPIASYVSMRVNWVARN